MNGSNTSIGYGSYRILGSQGNRALTPASPCSLKAEQHLRYRSEVSSVTGDKRETRSRVFI